jgi:hypothetical protein
MNRRRSVPLILLRGIGYIWALSVVNRTVGREPCVAGVRPRW